MARLARIAFLATLLVAAAALAACADNTEGNAYVRQLTAAQMRYQKTAERIETRATATSSPREDRVTLDRFSTAITDTIKALRAIRPPPKVTEEHGRYVAVFVRWHNSVERLVRAIRNPTQAGIERAQRRIAVANAAFNRDLRDAGTDIDAKLEG